jgi:hypothetical protein
MEILDMGRVYLSEIVVFGIPLEEIIWASAFGAI